jgi:hypothetical protein
MFVKREKLDKCGEDYAPRVISSQQPRVTVFTGPVMTVVQDWLHWLWDGVKVPILFAAGCMPSRLSSFFDIMFHQGGSFFETDMSNYDSTVHAFLQDLFLKVVRAFGFDEEPHFWELRAAQQGWLKGIGASGCRFETPPNIKSGVADTCVCNSFVNAALHLFAIAKSANIRDVDGRLSLRKTLAHVKMMVMGDDNLGCVDPELSLAKVADFLKGVGMIPKFNLVEDPEQAVFLNQLPYPVSGGRHVFGPKLGRLFARLGWSSQEQRDPLAYNCAIGKGFRASCHHVPVLRALVERLIACGRRLGPGQPNHDRGLELNERFQRRHLGYVWSTLAREDQIFEASVETMAFMARRYGWDVGRVEHLEAFIAGWPDPPCFVGNLLLEEAIALDCA